MIATPGFAMSTSTALALILTASAVGCARLPAEATNNSTLQDGPAEDSTSLSPSSTQLDFGTLPRGGKRQISFSLANRQEYPIQVGQIQTSCDCFRVELASNVVAAGQSVQATAILDLTNDVSFSGTLELDAKAFVEKRSQLAFSMHSGPCKQE